MHTPTRTRAPQTPRIAVARAAPPTTPCPIPIPIPTIHPRPIPIPGERRQFRDRQAKGLRRSVLRSVVRMERRLGSVEARVAGVDLGLRLVRDVDLRVVRSLGVGELRSSVEVVCLEFELVRPAVSLIAPIEPAIVHAIIVARTLERRCAGARVGGTAPAEAEVVRGGEDERPRGGGDELQCGGGECLRVVFLLLMLGLRRGKLGRGEGGGEGVRCHV